MYQWLLDQEYSERLPQSERDALAALRAIALDVADGRLNSIALERAIIELINTITASEFKSGALVDVASKLHARWSAYDFDAAELTSLRVDFAIQLQAVPAAFHAVMTAESPERPALQSLVAGLPQR